MTLIMKLAPDWDIFKVSFYVLSAISVCSVFAFWILYAPAWAEFGYPGMNQVTGKMLDHPGWFFTEPQARRRTDVTLTVLENKLGRAPSGNVIRSWEHAPLVRTLLTGYKETMTASVCGAGVFRARGTLKIELLGIGSYDDMQWWSLAYASAGLQLHDQPMIESAAAIFDHVWQKAYSNSSKECFGGVWWSKKRTYKNAVTNELVIANAALLHKATGKASYLQQALDQWRWFNASGMINQKTGAICDGLSIDSHTYACSGSGGPSYTYNQGVVLGGLATLFEATGDVELLDAAHKIADGTINTGAPYVTTEGILQECGSIHDRDGALFKGIFIRNLRMLVDACNGSAARPHDKAQAQRYSTFIQKNFESMMAHARTPDGLYSAYWQGPVDPKTKPCQQPGKAECGNATGTVPQISALELLTAAI